MSYDTWKGTDPALEWLGDAPESEDEPDELSDDMLAFMSTTACDDDSVF